MAAPVSGIVWTYIGTRAAAFLGRKAITTVGKKTARQRMQSEAAKRGGRSMSPAPQGPYWVPLPQSRGGEHTSRSGTPSAGISTPGPSAQNKSRASRKKSRGMISRANRRGAPSRGRRRPRTPYCRTHKKRHWCKFTRR